MTIQKNINTKGNNIEEDDDLGRKMYLVLCLQRGHLEEALEAAKKLLAKRPKDSVLKDLIRYKRHFTIGNISQPYGVIVFITKI